MAFVSNLLFFISCLSLYSTYGIALVFLPNLDIIFLINLLLHKGRAASCINTFLILNFFKFFKALKDEICLVSPGFE